MAAGVATAIGAYVLLCLFGLTLVLNALPWLSSMLSIAGALYLAWLGIGCLRSKGLMPETSPRKQRRAGVRDGLPDQLAESEGDVLLWLDSVAGADAGSGGSDMVMLWLLLAGESFRGSAWWRSFFFLARPRWLRHRLVWFERAVGVVLLGLAAKVANVRVALRSVGFHVSLPIRPVSRSA